MYSKLVGMLAIGVIAVGVVTTANAQKSGPAGQRFDTGKYEYMAHCTTCHGDSGKGDGPLVASLMKRPADLTKIALQRDRLRAVFLFEDHGFPRTVFHGGAAAPHEAAAPSRAVHMAWRVRER